MDETSEMPTADHKLEQILSARYYQPASKDRNPILKNGNTNPHENDTIPQNSSPGMRITINASKTDRVKKRGRPRLPTDDAVSSSTQDRRAQIRSAQRTYRLKKEAMFRDMASRVEELETSMRNIEDSLSAFCSLAVQSDLHVTHPALFKKLHGIVDRLQDGEEGLRHSTEGFEDSRLGRGIPVAASSNISIPEDDVVFGYTPVEKDGTIDVDNDMLTDNNPKQSTHSTRHHQPNTPIERPLNNTTIYTYSIHESTFSRRLQRYSLEHAYRLFTNPSASPRTVYRVFRLVPCIQDKSKMNPYFRCLVRGSTNEPLEIATLPFYGIGGAGTHYPRVSAAGQPAYPENMRLPNRVLGGICRGDDEERRSESINTRLKMLDLDGVWLDCHDVQGYLEARGFETLQAGFDVELFLSVLVRGMVILGRAPGFRLVDVDSAFNSALMQS